jgi:hypothetical protein
MPRKLTWPLLVLGGVLLLFGLGCLNYAEAGGLEHHRESAARFGLLPPSEGIYFAGVASVVLGAGMLGFGLGRIRR